MFIVMDEMYELENTLKNELIFKSTDIMHKFNAHYVLKSNCKNLALKFRALILLQALKDALQQSQ